ncbi:MAG: MCP four helix bundle domain-containing protein [Candidatus Anammoxibacter sp.]
MIQNLKIRTKLLLLFLSIGIISVSITGWLGYQNASTSLENAYFDQLTAIRETKKRQTETYFRHIRNQIITFSEDQMVVDAMDQFKTAFFKIKDEIKSFDSKIQEYTPIVKDYYKDEYLARLNPQVQQKRDIEQYWPKDERYDHTVFFQYHYIANNPNPTKLKYNLEKADDGSEYSLIHSHYHPMIRNYLKKIWLLRYLFD